MTRSKINKIVIFCVCAFIVMLLVQSFNKHLDYTEVEQKWTAKKDQLAKVEANIAEFKQYIEQYETEKEEFDKYLFSEQDIPSFLDEISAYAGSTEVKIIDMKTQRFKAVTTAKGVSTPQAFIAKKRKARKTREKFKSQSDVKRILTLAAMPIKIKVEGTFSSFMEFFNYLDEFKQLITISNIEMASGREYPSLKCDFTLKIYSFKTLEELEYK